MRRFHRDSYFLFLISALNPKHQSHVAALVFLFLADSGCHQSALLPLHAPPSRKFSYSEMRALVRSQLSLAIKDYFRARYYSSPQGRFTSPDEFNGGPHEVGVLGNGDPQKQALPYADITEPQSLNKYQYTYNNPLNYVDDNGHCPFCIVFAVIAILASAEYAEAPTGHPGEVLHPSGTGQRDLVANIFIG